MDIYPVLLDIPELRSLVGSEILNKHNNGKTDSVDLLKDAFRAVLTSDKAILSTELQKLTDRFKKSGKTQKHYT